MAPEGEPIRLHAAPTVRSVPLGGEDVGRCRAETTARVAALLGEPPAALLTASCSSALEASAALVDLAPGDEVVVPAFTFPTSITPFALRGATIRFADVDPRTGNVDAASLRARLGPRTRVVVVLHYGGRAALGPREAAALAAAGIDVVEDAAHGLFASVGGRELGRLGRFGCLSFHRTKNVSALEGGVLAVNRPEDVDAALVAVDKGTDRAAFDAGRVPAYDWQGPGSAWRMGEGSLRYLAAELDATEHRQARRQQVWDRYQRELADWAAEIRADLPPPPGDAVLPAHLYPVVLASPDHRPAFVDHLAAQGVEAARHYGSMADSPAGRRLRGDRDACPGAARLAACLVRLPLHHDLDDRAVDRVVAAVRSWRP